MNKEDKHLLLKDLCARLPYGVIIQEYNEEYGYSDNALNTISIGYFSIHEASIEGTWINHIENVKPYLRPMSSMTSQEWCELCDCDTEDEKAAIFIKDGRRFVSHVNKETFLNSRHFDYRCLIEKGLAIAVTEENNPYK